MCYLPESRGLRNSLAAWLGSQVTRQGCEAEGCRGPPLGSLMKLLAGGFSFSFCSSWVSTRVPQDRNVGEK